MSEAAFSGGASNILAQMGALSGGDAASKSEGASATAASLMEQFGGANVEQAISNVMHQMVGEMVMNMVQNNPSLPDFMADEATNAMTNMMNEASAETPDGLDEQVSELLGTSGGEGSLSDSLTSIMDQAMLDETAGGAEGGSGSGRNWLVALAKALGAQAGEHLENMIDLGDKIGGVNSQESPELFAEMQAEMQGNAQMYKISSEGLSTALKSAGEALSALARKQ